MTRLQRALEAGWDPDALSEQYNAAVAEKKAGGGVAVRPTDRGRDSRDGRRTGRYREHPGAG
ncbi:MAG: hypothetical protein QOG10_5813 [Kribbellaceae bacterium]|jgi:hypothetical protein|nr:hypothetical protein [Kribbellaceae bacterium]